MEFNANDQDDSGNSRNPEQQQNRANQNMDPNNPIYLHHSDHPHYVLTTHVLNDRNYHRWKRSVEVSLNAKNKFVFVTGVCKEPVGDPSLAMQWKRCDSMVIAWLTHSVEKDIADTLLYCNTSAEIWNDLKTRFGHPNSSRIYQVQKDLFNVAQENLSITQYFTKFRKFWDEYMVLVDMPKCNSCGTLNPMPQFLVKQQIIQFLVGLNDSYNTVRGSILMIKPTPTIAEVYHMVLEEEKQRELNNASNVSNDSAAFNAYSRNGKNHSSNGYNGGNNNSNSNSGYSRSKGNENVNSSSNFGSSSSNNRNEKEKPVYFCDHCKITGHSISRCFKINGYPPRNDKGKKFAGNACENEERSDKGDKGSHNQEKTPAFTKDQYERLMALLSKQNTADDHGASMMAEQLPLLSLDALLQGDVAELSKLRHACTNWGFFQLVSHGVKSEVIERFKVAGKELFDMPMEEKRKFWRSPQDIDGFGEKFVFSEEQKLNWADSFALNILPLQLRKPHLLPLLPLPIREALEAYTSEIKQLATKIFDCMAEDLKIDKASWRRLFDDGREYIRMACYPPCPQYDKVIGSSPHSDASALTIVIQLNQVDGLEFKKDGRWLPITPLPNAFIVNIGDVMEILSNGIYKSVEHRVMVDPKMERLSAATFFHAGVEAEVGPAEGLVTSDTPARFRKTTTSEYLKGYFARPMTGKLYLDTVRIDV